MEVELVQQKKKEKRGERGKWYAWGKKKEEGSREGKRKWNWYNKERREKKRGKWANSEHEEKRREVGRIAKNGSEVHLIKKEGNEKRKHANGRHEERRGKVVKEKR